jgi:hypothetical protein
MPDSMYELNDQFRQALLNRERAAASQMVREYGKLWQVIRVRVEELAAQYYAAAEGGVNPPASWLYEMDRLQALQNQVEGEIRKFAQYTEGAIEKGQKEAIAAAQKNAVSLIDAGLPEGVHVKFNRLPKKAFENLVGFLQDGSPLKDLLNQLPGEAGKLVADGLQTGLLLGWNPTRTANHIREALGGNLARALRIARTETLRSYREATRQTYKANNHVVKGWEWRCARNERTCAMCWAMDGSEHSFEERLNDHICGRCSMLPLMKTWQELGFNIDEVKDRQPKTGIEAFEKLSHTEQLSILGPAKFAAYKDGAFKLSDLVGERTNLRWGSMRYEKSLTEILGKEKANAYTRLALLGAARNAPGYSANDLVQVAGLGLRELTPIELAKIQEYAAHLPFSTREIVIQKEYRGINFRGEVFDKKVRSDIYHLFKRTEIEEQWKTGIDFETYFNDLKSSIADPETRIVTYKFHNERFVGFYSPNHIKSDHLGDEKLRNIYTFYSVKWNTIISGYQVSGLDAIYIPDDAVWVK